MSDSDKIYLCKNQCLGNPNIRVECVICYDPPENCPNKAAGHRGCIHAKEVYLDTGRHRIQKPSACNNCIYFERKNFVDDYLNVEMESFEGLCRKHAPVTDGRSTQEAYKNRYPVTHDYEWCGEWKEAK